MTPSEIIALLSPKTPDLGARIATVSKTWSSSGTKISGRFFYVPLRDSKPTIDDLIDVAHARMVNFAIPRARIAEAVAEMEENPGVIDPFVRLTTEARDLFIKTAEETGRSGELGEILLYMLVEWVLQAPIVACKMYLKTAQQMPVHGTDGIHLGHEDGTLVMYWGESKMHSTLSSAITDIAASISGHVSDPKKRQNEIRLVRANLNLDGMSAEAQEALKNYFDPYKPESNNMVDAYACFAGFDSKIYSQVESLSGVEAEAAFLTLYNKRIETACALILEKVKGASLENFRFSYFLLPFPSVDDARQRFQSKLWGYK